MKSASRVARMGMVALAAVVFRAQDARAADARDDDPWVGTDKGLHFAVSASLAGAGYGVGAWLFDRRGDALLFGGGLALGAGVAKEALDLAGLGHPSWKDLAWDAMGIASGLLLAWGVDLIVRGVSKERPALGTSSPRLLAPAAGWAPLVVRF